MNTSLEQYHQMNKQNQLRLNNRYQQRTKRVFRRKLNQRQGPPQQNRNKDNRKRLIITNLNQDILNADLKKLFEECGLLTRCGIHFDRMGNSKGTADIEFETHDSAEKAIVKLNQADIRGQKISITYYNKHIHSRYYPKKRSLLGQKKYKRTTSKSSSQRPRKKLIIRIKRHYIRPTRPHFRNDNNSQQTMFNRAIRKRKH